MIPSMIVGAQGDDDGSGFEQRNPSGDVAINII